MSVQSYKCEQVTKGWWLAPSFSYIPRQTRTLNSLRIDDLGTNMLAVMEIVELIWQRFACVAVIDVHLAVSKIRRSNSWSEAYEDFAMMEENTEPAENCRETDKDRHDKMWLVLCLFYSFLCLISVKYLHGSLSTVYSHVIWLAIIVSK